jgi:hypothetical protein
MLPPGVAGRLPPLTTSIPRLGAALAWLIGSALMIAYTLIIWLVRGRAAQPQPAAEISGDISPVKQQSTLVAEQRLSGTITGAAVASLSC